MKELLLSVVMPVYNAELYLEEAIESILKQTYKNFEFIIINDGSTDKSLEIIEKYKDKDERIVVISRENRGLIASLNQGIKNANGKYIARMDADDISLPQRFEKQIELMESEHIDICGGHYIVISKCGKSIDAIITPVEDEMIILNLAINVPFAHGSVMFKRSLFNIFQYGNTDYKAVEDYSLWIEIFNSGYRFGNVDEFIFKYRDFNESFSKIKLNNMTKERKILSDVFIDKHNKSLKRVIDTVLNKLSIAAREEIHLQLVSYALRYRVMRVMRKINKKHLIIGLIKFILGK